MWAGLVHGVMTIAECWNAASCAYTNSARSYTSWTRLVWISSERHLQLISVHSIVQDVFTPSSLVNVSLPAGQTSSQLHAVMILLNNLQCECLIWASLVSGLACFMFDAEDLCVIAHMHGQSFTPVNLPHERYDVIGRHFRSDGASMWHRWPCSR